MNNKQWADTECPTASQQKKWWTEVEQKAVLITELTWNTHEGKEETPKVKDGTSTALPIQNLDEVTSFALEHLMYL